MNNKFMKTGLSLAVAGLMAVGSMAVFADSTTSTTSTSTDTSKTANFKGMKGMGAGHDPILDRMVKDGVITQAQVDAYVTKVQEERDAAVKTAIQKLVTDGKLTQAKADAVIAAMAQAKTEREALRTKLAGMTADEVKAYLEANKPSFSNPLQALVTAGTLTTEDLTALKSVMGVGGPGMGGEPGQGGHDNHQKMEGHRGNKTNTSTSTTTTN